MEILEVSPRTVGNWDQDRGIECLMLDELKLFIFWFLLIVLLLSILSHFITYDEIVKTGIKFISHYLFLGAILYFINRKSRKNEVPGIGILLSWKKNGIYNKKYNWIHYEQEYISSNTRLVTDTLPLPYVSVFYC